MAVRFVTDFPGGSGLLLDSADGAEGAEVRFAAAPKNCPQALWFHFRVEGLDGHPLRCVLANPEQTLGGPDWSANRICCRADGGAWRRSDAPEGVEAPGGRVEWAWVLPAAEQLEVAVCYPYQPADLDATLADVGGAFDSAFIGITAGVRRLSRVFGAGEAGPSRPLIYLTARHHAGETPGSWVLDGLLRHVAATPALRDGAAWWAVPFVDLDDVVEGSYGKDPWPHDANRAYGPGGAARSDVDAVMADLHHAKALGLRLMIDLHAPSHREQSNYAVVRGWYEGAPINPVAEPFGRAVHQATPEDIRSPDASRLPPPSDCPFRGFSSTRFAQEVLGVEAVCLETSYQGNGAAAYAIDDYRRIGAAVAEAAADWVHRPA